jgi:hypothetical protein
MHREVPEMNNVSNAPACSHHGHRRVQGNIEVVDGRCFGHETIIKKKPGDGRKPNAHRRYLPNLHPTQIAPYCACQKSDLAPKCHAEDIER